MLLLPFHQEKLKHVINSVAVSISSPPALSGFPPAQISSLSDAANEKALARKSLLSQN